MKQQNSTTTADKNNGTKSDAGYRFLPDSNLLRFAKQFSDNYKKAPVGEYFSYNEKYHIRYLKRIKDTNTGARISGVTGIIEIDKTIFKSKEYTPDFVFFIILWCVVCGEQKDIKLADKITIEYYLTTGRSRKNLALGYLKLFSKVLTELNRERWKLIAQQNGDLNYPMLKQGDSV